MRVYHTDQFTLPLPPGHRFPLAKYRRLRERVVADGTVDPEELTVPEAVDDRTLLRVHTAAYVRRVVQGRLDPGEVRRIGFPWSPELVERSRRSVGATVEAARAALQDGAAVTLSGGTHHAYADRGEGYCVFNDVAVAARAMQGEGGASRVLVVDCDVHQGNGTAAVFRDDPSVYTFGIFGAGNYPFAKERNDLDVSLPDGTGDDAYLEALTTALPGVIDRARAELAFYLAGADPYAGDRLGRLSLSRAGLAERDHIVVERLRRCGIPIVVTMAGGYAAPIDETVDIHAETVRVVKRVSET